MFATLALALQLVTAPAVEERRITAPDADQGVVASARHVYAIDNNVIAKLDRRTGKQVARWEGDKRLYPHINSCALVGTRLVCAASNYPAVPTASSVETFDADTLKPLGSRSLGPGRGSLTWLEWQGGSWWACFANYDSRADGRAGEPGRDHRWTTLVRFSPDFAEQGAWLFPASVLARVAPMSSSGGAWNADGLLYVTGHDRPEMYALRLPAAGATLEHVATIALPTEGQAIAWDPLDTRLLWSIARKPGAIVASRVPMVVAK